MTKKHLKMIMKANSKLDTKVTVMPADQLIAEFVELMGESIL